MVVCFILVGVIFGVDIIINKILGVGLFIVLVFVMFGWFM